MSTPEQSDTPEEANWEKRYKDTQAAYTKSRQELADLRAKVKVLEEKATVSLDPSVEEELNDLKYNDPDKWRQRINELEDEAKQKLSSDINHTAELERRKEILDEFSRRHPDIQINDEVIQYDVPRRITSKLEKGEVDFEEFLQEVHAYLKTPKTTAASPETMDQPNLSKSGGDASPSKSSVDQDTILSYRDEVY